MSVAGQVLMVDNDPALCRLMEVAFARSGLELLATGDSAEALSAIRGGTIAALLMDLNLGAGQSGPELLAAWAQELALPPIWMVTGTPDDARLDSIRAAPALQKVVAKPFSVLELAEEVALVVRGGTEKELGS